MSILKRPAESRPSAFGAKGPDGRINTKLRGGARIMYDLRQVGERTWYVFCHDIFGLYQLNETDVCMIDAGWSDDSAALVSGLVATKFEGYETCSIDSAEILCIIADNEAAAEISGDAMIILDRTPFYAESGGQVGDTGFIKTKNGTFKVNDTKKVCGDKFAHIGTVTEGSISLGKIESAEVDVARRNAIKRNHSAAHMLQAALKTVLGDHVEQSGSYVDAERVRFDFTHNKGMTKEEIAKVESIVNEFILSAQSVTSTEMPIEEAKKTGATALFGEKYGEFVRVVKMGDFSTEFCGGTHLSNSAEAGLFKVISESSVAAGIRRIEGTTGKNIIDKLNADEETISKTRAALKITGTDDIAKRCADLSEEMKGMKKELDALKTKLALNDALSAFEKAEAVGGFKVCTAKFDGVATDTLRNVIDDLKARDDSAVVVFASVAGDKITFAAGCGKGAVANGAHAGNILKQVSAITGGGGGGRPDSATSGGKDVSKLDEALAAVIGILGGK
jgi:alanyl-tRNA synthetase